ncbi:MAG: hypothetical protein EA384_14805 [Spirochaetaceae bacterium]|nr:MAG: hypothetical protein EA384_14805 [Spirochaetaceae bacterium]
MHSQSALIVISSIASREVVQAALQDQGIGVYHLAWDGTIDRLPLDDGLIVIDQAGLAALEPNARDTLLASTFASTRDTVLVCSVDEYFSAPRSCFSLVLVTPLLPRVVQTALQQLVDARRTGIAR